MSLWREIRELPSIVWVLFAGAFINRFGSFVLVFLALYLKSGGYTGAQIGITLGAYGAGGIVAALVGGYLADVFGRRNTIVLSMGLSAAAMIGLSQAASFVALVALSGAAGATAELYRPACTALLADATRPDQRVTAFAVYRLAINLGFAAGPAVGGLLAEKSFFLVFAGDAVTSVLFAGVAVALLPNRTTSHETPLPGSGLGVIIRDRYFLLFLVASTMVSFVFMQSHTTYPLQTDIYGHSAKAYGLLLSINGLLITLIELPITSITKRANAHAVMFLGMLLVGAGFGLTALVSSFGALAATVVVWTMGEIIVAPVAGAHVAEISPPGMRGRYMGMYTMSWAIGGVLAPLLGTMVLYAAPRGLWLSCFILGAMAAVIVGVARPRQVSAHSAPRAS